MAKDQCVFCDGESSFKAYEEDPDTTAREIEGVLALWKLCTTHAHQMDKLHAIIEQKEIEKTVC